MNNADEQRVFPCRDCGLLRSKAEGGHIFPVCDRCWDQMFRTPDTDKRLATLAHNLAIGGALCRAHRQGVEWHHTVPELRWDPGCGRSAP